MLAKKENEGRIEVEHCTPKHRSLRYCG